jgi:hypothetical protein
VGGVGRMRSHGGFLVGTLPPDGMCLRSFTRLKQALMKARHRRCRNGDNCNFSHEGLPGRGF